jgi:hypothetical protein
MSAIPDPSLDIVGRPEPLDRLFHEISRFLLGAIGSITMNTG